MEDNSPQCEKYMSHTRCSPSMKTEKVGKNTLLCMTASVDQCTKSEFAAKPHQKRRDPELVVKVKYRCCSD